MKRDTKKFVIVMGISLGLAWYWDKSPVIPNAVGFVLDPTLGALLSWNLYIGFAIIVGMTSLCITLAQKYLSNQIMLKEIKKEQKYVQDQLKKYKDHPEKVMELQKELFAFFPKTFELTLRPLMYTSIPIILLFRWFGEALRPVFGGWWIFYYMVGSMIFSVVFRKYLDVA